MVNTTGWEELFNGHMISAAFTMYDQAFIGWTVAILFLLYQVMLYLKTRNLTLGWVTGLIFLSIFATANSEVIKPISLQVMFVIMVIQLGGILYLIFWK